MGEKNPHKAGIPYKHHVHRMQFQIHTWTIGIKLGIMLIYVQIIPSLLGNATMDIAISNLLSLPTSSQHAIRCIRNEASVRRNMYTDHVISKNEHEQWLAKVASDSSSAHGAVLMNAHTPIGLVSITNIRHGSTSADWAFYLSEKVQGRGYGAALEVAVLNYAFEELGFRKLNCEVLEGNEIVMKMHLKFGFKAEGLKRSFIPRDGRLLGAYLLGITREEWAEKRHSFHPRHLVNIDLSYNTVKTLPCAGNAVVENGHAQGAIKHYFKRLG